MPATVAQTIESYDQLVAAIRARADDMSMTRLEIDHQSGLQSGYSGKLLGSRRTKTMGLTSLGLMLGALGLKLILVEDSVQTAKILARRKPRERPIRELNSEPGTIERDLERIDDLARIVLDGPDG